MPHKQVKKKDNDQNELEKAQQELTEMTELAKRTMADLQNLRRRQEEEKTLWIKMANAELIKAILPVLDTLNRAKQNIPEEAKEWAEGINICLGQFESVLKEFGLQPIECKDQAFNPDLHEALIQGPGEKNIVIEELEKGYMLGGRIIRHAKVKVGNGEKA